MSNNVPVLMLRGANGKFFPVAGITGGGGSGGTGGASTAANVSYTNTQLPNVKNVKTALDELVPNSHSHDNKSVLDKFAETDGKPTYDGKALGGGGASSAEDVSYTLSEDVQTTFPDVELDSDTVKSGLDVAMYYALAGMLAKYIQCDVPTATGTVTFDLQTVMDGWRPALEKAHEHANKSVLDLISATDGKLRYNGSDVGLKGEKGDKGSDATVTKANVVAALGYTPEAVSTQVTTGSNITLADNTEYRLTDVTTLNLSYPTGNFECWMSLTFAASGAIMVTLPTGTKYLGSSPNFKNGETWEVSIKDGVVVAQKVGDGSIAPIETVEDGTEVSY